MLRHTLVPSMCAAALLAACANGGMTEPSTIAPTLATSPAVTTAATSAVATSTTVADTAGSTTSATAVPTVALSPDGPWTRVDSAPGVDTPGLFYELMPKLWVYLPTVEDLEHGITWVFTEPDRPVIEAYLRAQLTYYEAATTGHIDKAAWDVVFAESDETAERLALRLVDGEHVELDAGVVLRPSVLGEERSDTTAIVFDCTLDGSVFLTPSGRLASGSSWGVLEVGGASRLGQTSDGWIVTQTGRQPEACL